MFEHQKELNKIEQWIEKLPYSSVEVKITMQDRTELSLSKEKHNPMGFQPKET